MSEEWVKVLPHVYARGAWRIQKTSAGWAWHYVVQVPLVPRSPRGLAKTLTQAKRDVDTEIRLGGEPTIEQPKSNL